MTKDVKPKQNTEDVLPINKQTLEYCERVLAEEPVIPATAEKRAALQARIDELKAGK